MLDASLLPLVAILVAYLVIGTVFAVAIGRQLKRNAEAIERQAEARRARLRRATAGYGYDAPSAPLYGGHAAPQTCQASAHGQAAESACYSDAPSPAGD